MSCIKVVVKYFWGGSDFYSGNLDHCVALPLEPVPEDMKGNLRETITPHFRFSPIPAPVKQTIATMPGYVTAKGDNGVWHPCMLELTENGYLFHDDLERFPLLMMTTEGPDAGRVFRLEELPRGT